ncbi:MAG TPA: RNA methyltransferase [Lachnospiraceae bacterium]|nr:RNA methyltransferase [Lachnospiraceae bacterium]
MINSTSNQRVKQIVAWNQKGKLRNEQKVFLVEGIKMFLEAPVEQIMEVYVSENLHLDNLLMKKLKMCNWETVSGQVFSKISDTKTPQGILCVLRQFKYDVGDITHKKNPLIMLLEDIQDPGNLGTILRTAEGAGVDGVIMSMETVDIYNPKTIRATMGSIYRMPFVYTEDLVDTMDTLKENGIRIYAAHLKGTVLYDEASYIEGTGFLIGNEGNGLKDKTANKADVYIKIPMDGKVESLNAAIASTVLMYEANRQKRHN